MTDDRPVNGGGQSRRSFLAALPLPVAALPFTDMTHQTDETAMRVDLGPDAEMVVEYVGTFDRMLATDRLLYLSSFDAVEWRDVLAEGEHAAVFTVDTTGLDEPPGPPTAEMFTGNDNPPLRTTTAAEWLADPTVEPRPGPHTQYWQCAAPVHSGNGGAMAFPISCGASSVELRFDDGDSVDDVLEVDSDD